MMKYKKQELLDVLNTLKKVNNLIGEQGKAKEQALDILSQCQESAITIGNDMEARGTAGEAIIHILEEYCENLYQMHMAIDNDQTRKVLAKRIKEQLMELAYRIENDLPEDKRKVAFFVYKASMWDALESIWKAAVSDERCEVYVVPIPYYAKNEDGTLGDEFYEGNELPEEVAITDWKNFELEEQQVDVAYIHNPYDSFNKVTCVYPRFFASNLKKYVKTLVYVPYFVTMNYVEDHFCVLPGVLYSDAVVVQTETVKNKYLENIKKFEQENKLGNTFSKNEDKFCIYGSPKFDKILNFKKENIEIVPEWRHKIYRQDGTRKKVILFNTSIQELILYGEKQIEKIERVISLFEQRKDMVLLWRPHPLNDSTVKAMMPQLLQRYLALEETFQNDGNGIFDNTAELHRAMAISDAYYGTGGSLIPLYGLTGKPILKENTELLEIEDNLKNRYISLADGYVDETGAVWFCAIEFNGLFKYDIAKDRLEWKGRFPEETLERRYLYNSCMEYGNKLFFPPYIAKEFAVYDKETETFKKIPINDYGVAGGKIYAIAQYGNILYCFGGQIPAVLCLNLDTYEITYFEDLYTELQKYYTDDKTVILNRDVIVENNICWLSCGRANIVVEFHMDTMRYRIYKVGNEENRYISMKKANGKFYLLPRNAANIVCWDSKENISRELVIANADACEKNAYFNTCIYENELWLFALQGQHIAKINTETDEITWMEDMHTYAGDEIFQTDEKQFGEQKISWAYRAGRYICYFSYMNKSLYIKNMENGQVEKRHLKMREDDFHKARVTPLFCERDTKEYASRFVFRENTSMMLANYLDWVAESEELCSQKQITVFLAENSEGHADCGRLCHEKFDLKE